MNVKGALCTCGNAAYSGDDFYCDVALKNIPALNPLHNSALVLAYPHTKPHWPVHIVVVPKMHVTSFTSINVGHDGQLWGEFFPVAQKIARKVEEEHGAARVITNLGRYQDSKHFHVHICSGDPLPRPA